MKIPHFYSDITALILRELHKPIVALMSIFIIGFFGYIYIEGCTPLESLYMLVITFSTIGYGEVQPLSDTGRILTMGLIISGFTAGVFSIGRISTFFIDGELSKLIKIKAMNKVLNSLSGHYIVCGYGKTGRRVVDQLLQMGKKVVLIEGDSDRNEKLKELYHENLIHIVGDSSNDEILLQAGVMRAHMLMSLLTSDAENVFVTISVKDLNKALIVITRVEDVNSTVKVKKSGADFIISPIDIATDRIISIATAGKDFYNFMEFAGRNEDSKDYKFGLVNINSKSDLIGKAYREANIPQRTNLVVIGFYSASDELQVNPKADNIINLGDRLLVFGEEAQINQLKVIAKHK